MKSCPCLLQLKKLRIKRDVTLSSILFFYLYICLINQYKYKSNDQLNQVIDPLNSIIFYIISIIIYNPF